MGSIKLALTFWLDTVEVYRIGPLTAPSANELYQTDLESA
jgi:hypothetical protein